MSILNWFANTWKAVMNVFAYIWKAAQEAVLASWNSDAIVQKLAAALLVAIAVAIFYVAAWGMPVSMFVYTVGSLTSTLAVSLIGIHMLAVFAWRLFRPVDEAAAAAEATRKFAEEYPAGKVTEGPDPKAQAARANTRVVA